MTQQNPIPEADMIQREHENDANAKRVVALGKTTGGDYVEIKVDSNGALA